MNRFSCWFYCLFIVLFILLAYQTSQVLAHRPFESYVQQHSRITLKERYVDVTHHLSLTDDFAHKARQMMDVDENGLISDYEVKWAQSNFHHLFPQGISLGSSGEWQEMTELYSPEFDLHSTEQVDGTRLEITSYYFFEYDIDSMTIHDLLLIQTDFYADIPAVWSWEITTENIKEFTVSCDAVDERFQGGSMIVSETIASVSRTIYIEIKNNLSGEKQ